VSWTGFHLTRDTIHCWTLWIRQWTFFIKHVLLFLLPFLYQEVTSSRNIFIYIYKRRHKLNINKLTFENNANNIFFSNFTEYNFATQNVNEMLTTELRRHPEKCEISHKYLTLWNKVFVINQKLWSCNARCIFPYCLEKTPEQSKIYVLVPLIHFAHQSTCLTVMYGYT
jgi:hypothetical protein